MNLLTKREMGTVIRNINSNWKEVTSGVPQGSVLASVMFAIYINDMARCDKLQEYVWLMLQKG